MFPNFKAPFSRSANEYLLTGLDKSKLEKKYGSWSITQKTNLRDLQVFQAFSHHSMWAYYIGKPIDKLVG